MTPSRRHALALLLALALPPSCKRNSEGSTSGPPSATRRSTVPDEGPLPDLRTGAEAPATRADIKGSVVAQHRDDAQYFEIELEGHNPTDVERVFIDVPGAVATVHFDSIFVRLPRPLPSGTATLEGQLVTREYRRGVDRYIVAKLSVPLRAAPHDDELPQRWARHWGDELTEGFGPTHPWRNFAAGRVRTLVDRRAATGATVVPRTPRRPTTELSELMYTTTAATSMQEALQVDRGLRIRVDAGPRTIPITTLAAPKLEDHPFERMHEALPDPDAGTPEPLAKSTPADFWYVRFDDIRVMLRVLDEADAWITPVANVMESRAEVRDLAARYQRQLGLGRSGLAKALGHTVIDRVAIVGSDAYLREGSDVTFIFEVASDTAFDSELERHLDRHRKDVSGIAASTLSYRAHEIMVHRDPTRTVNQHRARVGDLTIVSNSEAACRAVLDAIDGKRDRLSDQKDLAYMLARDPGEHDAFAFLGDRFIANVVSPAQKIQAARRQTALAELLTPGYTALLYGWLYGKSPRDTESLIAAGLLERDELAHADGNAITFAPGTGARSRYGRPDALTPLIDLPAPTTVSEAEKRAYQTFAEGYQEQWQRFVDPIAVRLDVEGDEDEGSIAFDVRVLPLIDGTEYRDLAEIVGDERIEVPEIGDGMQMVWAVGEDSDLRRDLDKGAAGLSGNRDIGLGWLGDWVMVGSLDRRSIVDAFVASEAPVQVPAEESEDDDDRDREMLAAVGKLPVYAAAQVRNPAGLVATLAGVKSAINGFAPDIIEWTEHSRYRDHGIVRVGVSKKARREYAEMGDAIALYYVQAGGALILALNEATLHTLIDRIEDEATPTRGDADGPQFVAEARLEHGRSAWTAALWALQAQANEVSEAGYIAAEILLRGAPDVTSEAQLRQRGLAYFGSYPVTASGRSDYTLGALGAGDPVHGSLYAPRYPTLPVEGAPIETLMNRLTGGRATVAFDTEPGGLTPPARSLHTRIELQMGTP